MLYLTTRNPGAAYTAWRAASAPDVPGEGWLVPMRIPKLEPARVEALLSASPGECVAELVNEFFPVHLEPRAAEEALEMEIRLAPIPYRTTMAELWSGPEKCLSAGVRRAAAAAGAPEAPGSWMEVAVLAGLLFASVGALRRRGGLEGDAPLQLALTDENPVLPVAAWYAKRLGLPVGRILIASGSGGLWQLIHQGELRPDGPVPAGLERVMFDAFGPERACAFGRALETRRSFRLLPEEQQRLQEVLGVSVISPRRAVESIPRVYRSSDYLMSPQTAAAYAGLLDYRALSRESGPALVLSEESPAVYAAQVLEAMGLPQENRTRQIETCMERAALRRAARGE